MNNISISNAPILLNRKKFQNFYYSLLIINYSSKYGIKLSNGSVGPLQ